MFGRAIGNRRRMAPGRKLTGMRVGIAGLGRIGIELARRLEPFKTEISYADPISRDVPYRRVDGSRGPGGAVGPAVSLRGRAAQGSRRATRRPPLFSTLSARTAFSSTSPAGWLVDEPALIAALQEGRLGGAGLDVFYDEPHVPAALRSLDNVVLTPHIASSTTETMRAMGENVVANLVSWFKGSRPRHAHRSVMTPDRAQSRTPSTKFCSWSTSEPVIGIEASLRRNTASRATSSGLMRRPPRHGGLGLGEPTLALAELCRPAWRVRPAYRPSPD